ncbi:MAG: outer membrane protein assembly factor BamD [Betaproteobacteria bacterium]|nr:outer membrane protein assembly factor BamD [Betaproteobacteria bacterium]
MTDRSARRKPSALLAGFFLAVSLTLSGCGIGSDGPDPTSGWTAEKLYAEAKAELSAGNLAQATRLFGRLESRYPFGRYAQQAQLELAYGHYKLGEKEQALSALEAIKVLSEPAAAVS